MKKNRRFHFNSITVGGMVLIGVAVVLFIASEFFKLPQVQQWYEQYDHIMVNFEEYIVNLPNKAGIFLIIMLLFFIKALLPFPIYPISFLCVLTSVVYNVYLSLLINTLGLVILFSAKYVWGKRLGSGFAGRVLPRYKKAWGIVEHNGNGNPWLLVGLRAVPSFPINAVSGLYGSLDFGFGKYILLSVLGFIPKLTFYTIIGRNVFDPLSSAFILPIAILILFSGVSMISINMIVDAINRKTNQQS